MGKKLKMLLYQFAFWSECSLSILWVPSECLLSALWVLSEYSLSALWVLPQVILMSSLCHPEVILKSSWSHPEVKCREKFKCVMCVTYFFKIGLCGSHHVDIDIAQLHHYRKDCYEGWDDCPPPQQREIVRDDRVLTHLDTVISNSNSAIKAIDFE